MNDLIDALIPVNPEPCDTCKMGITSMTCWDGVRRCKNCVQAYAHKMGWDNWTLDEEAQRKADRMAKPSLLDDPEWNPRSRTDPLPSPRPTADPSLGV